MKLAFWGDLGSKYLFRDWAWNMVRYKINQFTEEEVFFLLQTNSPSGNFNVRKKIMKQILLLFFFHNSVAGELMKSWISVFSHYIHDS